MLLQQHIAASRYALRTLNQSDQTNQTDQIDKSIKDLTPSHKFNDIAEILGIDPVTAGRCAERGKKLIDNDEGIWDILAKCR